MLPHSEPAVPMLVTVAPWGIMDTAELANAVVAANAAQGRFRFGLSREALPLDAESYRLPDGGLDLDKAARDLVRRKPFRQLASGNLILVTTEPYSAPGAVGSEGEINPLPGYFHDDDVLGDGRVSIVSTFLWDRLPSKPDLDVLAPSGGRRVQTPYLLRTGESISVGLSPFAPRKPRSFAERKATLISAPVLSD